MSTNHLPKSFDPKTCTSEIREILDTAERVRRKESEEMVRRADECLPRLLKGMFELGRLLHSTGRRSEALIIGDLLVGRIVGEIMNKGRGKGGQTFVVSNVNAEHYGKEGELTTKQQFKTQSSSSEEQLEKQQQRQPNPPDILTNLPPSLDNDTLRSFFALVEGFLWDKGDAKSLSVGMGLVGWIVEGFEEMGKEEIVKDDSSSKKRTVKTLLRRYGVPEMLHRGARYSSEKADVLSNNNNNRDQKKSSRKRHSRKRKSPAAAAVLKCPKNHIATFHFTAHSSFRCDGCGGRVAELSPMYVGRAERSEQKRWQSRNIF